MYYKREEECTSAAQESLKRKGGLWGCVPWDGGGAVKSNRDVPIKVGNFVQGRRGPDFWEVSAE